MPSKHRLAPGQARVFQLLVDKQVPDEWAYLIAERVEESHALMMREDLGPSAMLCSGFSWRHSPEGYEFWLSVSEALRDEQYVSLFP